MRTLEEIDDDLNNTEREVRYLKEKVLELGEKLTFPENKPVKDKSDIDVLNRIIVEKNKHIDELVGKLTTANNRIMSLEHVIEELNKTVNRDPDEN